MDISGVDVNNLSDDKVQEAYEDVMYSRIHGNKTTQLTNEQVLDGNYNIIDMENDEIVLINGQNVNLENLSDDEVLALYNDVLDDSPLVADYESCTITTKKSNEVFYYNITYNQKYADVSLYCYDNNMSKPFTLILYGDVEDGNYMASLLTSLNLANYIDLYVDCKFSCTGYRIGGGIVRFRCMSLI